MTIESEIFKLERESVLKSGDLVLIKAYVLKYKIKHLLGLSDLELLKAAEKTPRWEILPTYVSRGQVRYEADKPKARAKW